MTRLIKLLWAQPPGAVPAGLAGWISPGRIGYVPGMRRRLAIILWAALLSPGLAYAKASAVTPATHTVYPGQTLGMIAKRYNVTIDELCAANSITRRSRIKPGQVLVVPGAHAGVQTNEPS
jgi:LysM repeat protein